MDARKAFDVVWHSSALVALNEQGVEGPLWRLYVDMYESVSSQVKVNGQLSRVIKERQGIRQGGLSSTEIFKGRANNLLHQLAKLPDCMRVGSISVSSPTTADDTCLLSHTGIGAQTAILVAQDDANRERYEFSTTKTKTLLCNSSVNAETANEAIPLQLNGSTLAYSNSETHLGLERSTDCKASATVSERIKCGRRMAYALMGAGLHGLNGVSPKVSINMLSTYVIPAVMHGLETMKLSTADYKHLNKFHRQMLRQMQHLPQATATCALYLLTGSTPLEALHHKSTLGLFGNILRREGSVERELVIRQLAVKSLDSNSWVVNVRQLLEKYQLPNAFSLVGNPPEKPQWKKMVKNAISTHWDDVLKTEAEKKTSLEYLNLDACAPGQVHPVWNCGHDPCQVTMATTKVRLLVQRYALTGSHCAGKNQRTSCPLCMGGTEDVQHFLLECPALEEVRQPYCRQISNILQEFYYQPNNINDLVQVVLDCSVIIWMPPDVRRELESITRKLCFKLHNSRAVMTGRESFRVNPIKSVRY